MIRLPRFTPKLLNVLTLLAGAGVCFGPAGSLLAQDAAPVALPTTLPTGPDAPTPTEDIKSAVENFWHYGKVARYDLATAEGQKIVAAGNDPQMVLVAFENVAAERGDDIDQWLLRWQSIDAMKDVTTQVIKVVSDGYRARRSDPKYIQQQIDRLGVNERAYGLAVGRLRESGELAVPLLINILRDPTKRQMQPLIRRTLRDIGRAGLNPLVAATEMKDWDTLAVIVGVLGDLGYDSAAPYLAKLRDSNDTPSTLKTIVADAINKLGPMRVGNTPASELFYNLGEKIYYDRASITADNRFPMGNIWSWKDSGLERVQVPLEIFNEVMTMRECEYTLQLGGPRSDDALSLWLASNYKREAELPEGAKDDTRPENYPTGHFWGVEAGAKYLNAALARAIKDHNGAVAFRVIRSMQQIVGQSNMFASETSRPLIDAMSFPERAVRFEAAFALAAALPQANFDGSQRVVPLLAEALSQTGTAGVIVVMPTADASNKMVDELKAAGYSVAGTTTAEGVVGAAASLPAVDVIVVSEDIGPGNVDQLLAIAGQNVRLSGAARVVMTKTTASIYEPRKVYDPLLTTTTATDANGLKVALDEARKKIGAIAIDPAVATQYATRAGELLLKVGISRGQVYDLAPGKAALLAALSDSRPDIVKLSGQVLGLLNDKDAQAGLLAAAEDTKNADEVRISLYRSLATNAKFFGNHLEAMQLTALEKTVAEGTSLDIRSAAAEARGALNLPADQAKSLIVKQAKP